MSGTNGLPPVATTMLRVVISSSPTRTRQGETMVASPATQSTPKPV